jgi:hypothetical protein
MPNWCHNDIAISCPSNPKKLKVLWEVIENNKDENGGRKFLGSLRPEPNYDDIVVPFAYPPLAGKTPTKGRNDAWWDWRVENWGTKWEIEDDGGIELDGDTITGSFLSAWSPPEEALIHFAKEHPDFHINLKYIEPGCGFCGRFCRDAMGQYRQNPELSSKSKKEWMDDADDMDQLAEFVVDCLGSGYWEDEEEEEEEEEFKPPAPMSVLDLMKALQAAKEALTAFHPEIINGELKKVTRSGRYY